MIALALDNHEMEQKVAVASVESLKLRKTTGALLADKKEAEDNLSKVVQLNLPGFKELRLGSQIKVEQEYRRDVTFEPVFLESNKFGGFQIRLVLKNPSN